MKWKYGLVILAMAIMVVALVLLVLFGIKGLEPKMQAAPDIKSRINQYKLVKEEQQLITDILTLRYEATVIQAKFQPAPQPAPVSPVPEPKQ